MVFNIDLRKYSEKWPVSLAQGIQSSVGATTSNFWGHSRKSKKSLTISSKNSAKTTIKIFMNKILKETLYLSNFLQLDWEGLLDGLQTPQELDRLPFKQTLLALPSRGQIQVFQANPMGNTPWTCPFLLWTSLIRGTLCLDFWIHVFHPLFLANFALNFLCEQMLNKNRINRAF